MLLLFRPPMPPLSTPCADSSTTLPVPLTARRLNLLKLANVLQVLALKRPAAILVLLEHANRMVADL